MKNWMLTLAFNILNCVYLWTKRSVFSQGQMEERWKRLLDRHSVRFPKYSGVTFKSWNLQCSWFWMNKLFQHGEFVFTFSECMFLCANKNFLFWRLSNDCQIGRPALVSGSPNRKKPHNKHLISLVFSVRTVNYGSLFFSIDLWPTRFTLGP